MKKIEYLKTLGILILFLMIITPLALLNQHNHHFDNREYQLFNTGWVHGITVIDELPVNLNTEQFQPATISKELPLVFRSRQQMLIRTSLQDLIVTLDGIIIYDHFHDSIGLMSSYASLWHIIEIPAHSNGLILEITTMSPYQSMSGRMNQVVYGTDAQINYYLFEHYGLRLIVGVVIILIGILFVALSYIVFRKISIGSILMGLSALFLGLWIVTESRLLQFIIGEPMVIGTLAYISLAMLPLPAAIYIKNYVIKDNKKIFDYLFIIYVINALFVTISHMSGLFDFFETVVGTQILILIGLVIAIVLMWLEVRKNQNKATIQNIFWMIIFIGAVALIEIVNFMLGNFDNTSVYLVVSTGILMLYLLVRYIKDILSRIRQGYESEIYQRLAYIDPLTKAKNRLAFNERINELFSSDAELSRLAMIYFDLNDLKKINDSQGHLEGDLALVESFHRINEVYKYYGEIFRIGGDEFVFIGTKLDHEGYGTINQDFEYFMKKQNMVSKYKIHISYGITFFDREVDATPKDIMRRADQEMYLNKQLTKASLVESD